MARINPGTRSIALGDFTITAINDGQFQAATSYVTGVSGDAAEAVLRQNFRPLPPRISVSCFLVERADKRAVVDFGAAGAFGAVLGHAHENLATLGVTPEQIDTVLLTHGHPDHIGGLLRDGAPAFPNASLHLNGAEADYWAHASGDAAENAAAVQAVLAAYGERVHHFGDGDEPLPGMRVVHLPGHTPGHSGFMIGSGQDTLFLWGDVVHLPGLQFAQPQAGMVFDTDTDQARATRLRAFDQAVSDGLLVAGIHHDFPIFGHVQRRGEGYGFEPLVWTPTSAGLFGQ